jgi:CRISPR-associated protein Cmr4
MTTATTEKTTSFMTYIVTGMALDPIHVGTGGSKLGRVDSTIVRDPVTRIPKIPGSSLAGVTRAYAAMAMENKRNASIRDKDFYPDCAGQGSGDKSHCRKPDCPICTTFGFASGKDAEGGFAGLASFSDMHVLLFPVATNQGPKWVTSPMALRAGGIKIESSLEDKIYTDKANGPLNLGWLYLETEKLDQLSNIVEELKKIGVAEYITGEVCIVSDKLFGHIVNSNLEVRTSVAIKPETGAAEEGALFTYEALPRGTVLAWEIVCRDPNHFKIKKEPITAVKSPDDIKKVIEAANSYLSHLGIGGMGTRGMGRLQVQAGEV